MKQKPTVGITLGCPCGIGPEIVAAALAHPRVKERLVPVVFGDGPTLARHPALRRLPLLRAAEVSKGHAGRVEVTQLSARERKPGKPGPAAGSAQWEFLQAAIAAAQLHELDALCTAPVSKEQIARSGVPFVGHTEALAAAFGKKVLMLMDGPELKIALATNHVPLAKVPRLLTRARLVAQLRLLSDCLRPSLARRPKIAVCGLNPHAGDGGLLGSEDARIIAPAIASARKLGVDCSGPYAADGLFAQRRQMPCDVALAMYHDQGLVAAKAVDFVHTVNVTLGLPIPRTSPDHGTAYDIAGKGLADSTPMRIALLRAAELASS